MDALSPFNVINTKLQCDEPLIHRTKSLLETFYRTLLVRFVKPSALLYKSAVDVDLDLAYNMKEDADINIDSGTLETLGHLQEDRKKDFFKSAKQFYLTSCKYMKSKLPFSDAVLCHAEVADPSRQLQSKLSSLHYFIKKFPSILPPGFSSDSLQQEFLEYQSTDIRSCVKKRADETWGEISKVVEREGQEPTFKALPKVMVAILSIPHSSAHCERVFSQVRKNATEFRGSMGHDMLQALMVNKGRDGKAVDIHTE